MIPYFILKLQIFFLVGSVGRAKEQLVAAKDNIALGKVQNLSNFIFIEIFVYINGLKSSLNTKKTIRLTFLVYKNIIFFQSTTCKD